jgi:hypothetical protein
MNKERLLKEKEDNFLKTCINYLKDFLTMNKLIKISETHYIIVDDSVKPGDYTLTYPGLYDKKITHSTQPLESNNLYRKLDFINIKPLSLSEVEEVIKDNHSENNEWNVYFDENDKMLIMNV